MLMKKIESDVLPDSVPNVTLIQLFDCYLILLWSTKETPMNYNSFFEKKEEENMSGPK